eukprot:TRINITY_DN7955_c0_g1_i1.p1 TRINITY_DN7955_c0_g1~~TRINITY_DN7955_c0_g1_i1.p1  ORF type:complete len:151 (+),score=45.29 TRINITY_DN7955_c0_g1_i1:39-455(+)
MKIDAYVECSALSSSNIDHIFYLARESVITPIHQFWDKYEKHLQPAFVKAIRRIYRLLASSEHNTMNDSQINNFQELCFGRKLDEQKIAALKETLKRRTTAALVSGQLSFTGFLEMMTMFIEKRRASTLRTMLTAFWK